VFFDLGFGVADVYRHGVLQLGACVTRLSQAVARAASPPPGLRVAEKTA